MCSNLFFLFVFLAVKEECSHAALLLSGRSRGVPEQAFPAPESRAAPQDQVSAAAFVSCSPLSLCFTHHPSAPMILCFWILHKHDQIKLEGSDTPKMWAGFMLVIDGIASGPWAHTNDETHRKTIEAKSSKVFQNKRLRLNMNWYFSSCDIPDPSCKQRKNVHHKQARSDSSEQMELLQ